MIERIEQPQRPDCQGYDGYTLPEIMELHQVPGLSVALIDEFKVQWVRGYGVADVQSLHPVTGDTLFQAASISKAITALVVLRVVQHGYFSLDSDVQPLLKQWQLPPNPYSNGIAITPRMLLSHTSGLGDVYGFPGYHPASPIPTIKQILNGEPPSNVGQPLFERAPLDAFKYSGAGTCILQQLLVDVLDQDFVEIMSEWVLQPIGMQHSTFQQPLLDSWNQDAARAHGMKGEAMDCKWRVYPELAAAGLWTTAHDLALFVIAVQKALAGLSDQLLSRSLAMEMVNPVGVGDYGCGFRVLKQGEGWFFEHRGSNWGFRSRLFAHKLKGYGCIVMANGKQGDAVIDVVKARIENQYGWDSIKQPVPLVQNAVRDC